MQTIHNFLVNLSAWGNAHENIIAILLVGSHARGNATSKIVMYNTRCSMYQNEVAILA